MKLKAFVVAVIFSIVCGVAYCQCPNGNCATGGGYFYPQFFNPFGWTYWNYGYTNTYKTNGNTNCTACQKNGVCADCPKCACENCACENGECSCKNCECENCPYRGECENCPSCVNCSKKETANETENVVPIPAEIPKEETAPAENGNSSLDNSPLEEEPIDGELIVPTPVLPLENSGDTQVEDTQTNAEEQKAEEPAIVAKNSGDFTPFCVQVVEIINGHRVRMGLRPLELDKSLADGCNYHSRYMASYGFQHAYNGGMECIAMGVNTPEALVNMWLNSSGHKAIIMSNVNRIGVGSWGTYHTLRVRY